MLLRLRDFPSAFAMVYTASVLNNEFLVLIPGARDIAREAGRGCPAAPRTSIVKGKE